MYIYEAMLRGAKLRGQCTGDWFKDDKSCALGSIWEGFDRIRSDAMDGKKVDYFCNVECPILSYNFQHPISRLIKPLCNIITSLNDVFRWPREAIAEWLKPIELEYERKQLALKDSVEQHVSKQSIQPLERTKETVK